MFEPGAVQRLSLVLLVLAMLVALPADAALPTVPAPVDDIVYARSFRLDVGFESRWGAERPLVTSGTILVLDVDPGLVRPRQTAEPVLYVGDRVAQRIHSGWPSGRMIVIVPGEIDLDSEPIYFGTPELPERVDRAMAAAELALARASGLLPLPAASVAQARSQGGLALSAYDSTELDLELNDLFGALVAPLAAAAP